MELPGRIMALDVGDARTGIAVTDPGQMIVSPHAVVQQPSRDKAIAAILEFVDALAPILIVSGLPLLENGDEGPQARRVRNFMALLAARTEVPVVFEDERYSTLDADEVFHAGGGKGRKRKEVIDKIAAAQILHRFLERREAGARP